jgi:pimeloyl-ACP methyl ester carboxylesterase
MVRDRYDSVANLAHWKKPIAVLLAEHDEIIPIAHGKNLFESLPHPKKRVLFKNAGHNSWPADASQAWWKEVMDFVSSAPLHSRLDSLPRPH